MTLRTTSSLLALTMALALGPQAAANNIGTAGAVNPEATGAPPGGAARTLNVGGNVVYREKITTTANGSVQLIFVDRTTLNVGPNSQLVIDEFVYDPKSNTGRMAATLTKGVMRFGGGQTSHTGGATIKTPSTTLGVRGGVATIRHDASTGTRVINHFGTISAQTATGTEIIRRPGFALTIAGNTAPAGSPTRVSRNEIDTNNSQLTSRGSQTGGRREIPTDQGASRAVGQANAPVQPTLVQGQQPQTTTQAAQVTTQPNTMQQEVPLQQVTQVATTGTQQSTTQTLVETTPVVPVTPVTPVLPQRRFYAMDENTALRVGQIMPSAFDPGGNWQETGVVGYGPGGANPDGTPNTTSRLMVAGLVINGQGSSQTSAIFFGNMDVFEETATNIPGGGLTAFNRLNSTARMGRLGAPLTPVPGGVTLDTAASPTTITFNDMDSNGTQRFPGTAGYTNYAPNGTATGANYSFTSTLQRTGTPVNLGTNRPEWTLEGFIGGLLGTHSTTTGQPTMANPIPLTGGTQINLTGGSRFGAEMWLENETMFGQTTAPGTVLESTIRFGHQGTGTRNRSAYVDYNYFGARTSRANDGTVNGQSLTSTTIQTGNGPFQLTPTNENGLMVNSTALNPQVFFPNVTFCNCEHTRWGFWSYTATRQGFLQNGAPDTVRDSVHLGTWVAGVPSPANLLPTTGTATYAGHAIGSIRNGNSEYVAAGNFSSTVNFGSSTANFAITNLDGANYSGSAILSAATSPTGIAARVIETGGTPAIGTNGAYMSLNGAFFNGSSGAGGEMAGQWTIAGYGSPLPGGTAPSVVAPPYIGSGIFQARR